MFQMIYYGGESLLGLFAGVSTYLLKELGPLASASSKVSSGSHFSELQAFPDAMLFPLMKEKFLL